MERKAVTASPTLLSPANVIGQHNLYNDSDETFFVSIDGDAEFETNEGIPIPPGKLWVHEPHVFSRGAAPAIYIRHGGSGTKYGAYGVT